MDKLRYFIVFYQAVAKNGNSHANYSTSVNDHSFLNKAELLNGLRENLTDRLKGGGVTITNILEVTKEDYESWGAPFEVKD